jgi:hypothetical protein
MGINGGYFSKPPSRGPCFGLISFVFFCFNNGAQGGRDHGSGATKCMIDERQPPTPPRLSSPRSTTIDAVASKLHQQ